VRDERFVLKAGQGILIAPGVPHRYEPIGNQEWLVRFATFQGTLVDDLKQQMLNTEYVFVNETYGAEYVTLHEQMLTLLDNENHDMLDVSAVAYRLLLGLTRSTRSAIDPNQPEYEQYVAPAIAYMQEHFAEPMLIGDIADFLRVSPQYFNRVFRRLIQQTPTEYLTQLRISHAKKLLISQRHLLVETVAELSGYQDPGYFSKIFKKQTGVSPLNYRRWQT
jgi:YesN/AraC family two-component response regulator